MSKRRAEGSIAPVAKRSAMEIQQTFNRSVEKALKERICIVGVENKGEYERIFAMCGTAGDLYHVTISLDEIKCDCPHGMQGATCKHILYILLRKCRVPRNSSLLKNKTLSTDEWACLFLPELAETEMIDADTKLRETFANITAQKQQNVIGGGGESDVTEERTRTGRLRAQIDADSECSICCCEFDSTDVTAWCRAQCGTNYHHACINMWSKHNSTCPYCRAEWQSDAKANDKSAEGKYEYINLLE